ncbi:copper ABC transporter ATP-binding protein [Longibacter salinarum]|uniref:Copper ABC transporter ATP-binding protein n=2 Tax=Longibacter salinarum TaxID=1850348 RepID=A0A2A8CU98_9BACT|nr:copper ABC transporter ATP-binding protein [Longibacter salinarum]
MIDLQNLKKRFGDLRVLRGVTTHVAKGDITAIVGPNGSGKTTLIKCILGLVRPDAGTVTIDGTTLDGSWQYRERIGYMPQGAPFPENLTAREIIAMLKDLRGNPENTDEELIDAFDLAPELDKPIRTLSGGNRQKVNAVTAFLFRPDLVILDEPTAGLDPTASSVLKDKIQAERQAGTTFILTSHVMSELEELADHLAFLLNGTIQFNGPIDDLKQSTGCHNLERAIAHLMQGNQI